VTEHSPPWPKRGPASYFPSIETKYGRSIAEWQKIIADCGLEKHMAIVGHLKSEYGMGHGHANALVGWTLGGNTARWQRSGLARTFDSGPFGSCR
jgi:hypothetical protein